MTGASNESVAHSMHAHHQEMVHELRELTSALVHAGPAATSSQRDAIVEWCRRDLLPHAMAEEKTLYRVASERSELAVLVAAMIQEHHNLAAHVDRLGAAAPDVAALEAAAVLALFASHLEKEEVHILPALVPDASVDLAMLLKGMHELIGTH